MGSKELFFYELEGRGYIFQNKKWDEAKHGFEDDMLNMAWEMWSSAKHRAKTQAVPEGFVLVEKLQLAQLMADMDYMGKKALGSDYVSFADIAMVLDEAIEAQEQGHD